MALQLARQLLADNRKRVEVGALAPLDEKQAEAEVAGREADLLSAQRTAALRENTLKSLLTDAYGDWQQSIIEPTEPLSGDPVPLDLQDSWGRGLTQRPDLVQARLNVERQGIELKYYKNQMFPQLDAFGSYGHFGSDQGTAGYGETFNQVGEGSQPFWSAGMQLTIPLMNSGARARYRSARAQSEQVVLSLKLLEQNIMVEIDDAVKFARSSHQRVNATRAARGYAEAALDAEQQKLENGKSTSFVVLQLQRDLTSARSAEISALIEYNRALSALARSEGSTLQRRGINLELE
jgi:outer membrane protein TolC